VPGPPLRSLGGTVIWESCRWSLAELRVPASFSRTKKAAKLVVAEELRRDKRVVVATAYGWTGQESSSGFINLAPSILHYNWF
jgi:hypothetical protein